MRRWFALTILGSMLSSQVAVIGCPAMHHDTAGAHQSHSSQARDQARHPHGNQTDAEPSSDSRHESDGECMMVVTCTNVALPMTEMLDDAGETHLEARSPTLALAYANPSPSSVTPPPKSA